MHGDFACFERREGERTRCTNSSVIIAFLASKSLSLMSLGVPGLKRISVAMTALLAASLAILSCGGKNSSSSKHTVSGLKFRAFVSNALFPTGATSTPVLNIVDATQDRVSTSNISLLGELQQPGLMALSPDLKLTLVFSPTGNTLAVIDNTTESIATVTGATTTIPTITLPGFTESIAISPDHSTAYVAVPSAPVTGQATGIVQVIDLGTGSTTASIPVPAAHFVVSSPDGNHVLVFSDNSDTVTVLTTFQIGTNSDPRSYMTGFDRPVWAIFNGNSAAYVFNCGAECGGGQSGVNILALGITSGGAIVPLSGATYGLLSGTTLYVVGSPLGMACGSNTAATHCGTLNLMNISSMTLDNSSPILIPDGYHDRMQLSQNGQLFIGSHSCTNVNIPGGEVRGCLAIFNTSNSSVIIPPQIGDATGIQQITGRNIVYACEGGVFQVFDTTTDQLLVQTPPVDLIVGYLTDVKLVDPPVGGQ
jgi:hypothetical protein